MVVCRGILLRPLPFRAPHPPSWLNKCLRTPLFRCHATHAGFGTCEATPDHLEQVIRRHFDALKAKLERLEQQLKEENEGKELRAASEARPHTGARQRRLETDMELQQ